MFMSPLFGPTTLSITTLNLMTINMLMKNTTFSIITRMLSDAVLNVLHSEFNVFIVKRSVIMLNVIMPNVAAPTSCSYFNFYY
jgi:hypothetical protein